jgi:hypothetical protein
LIGGIPHLLWAVNILVIVCNPPDAGGHIAETAIFDASSSLVHNSGGVVRKKSIRHEFIASNRVEMRDCSGRHARGKLPSHENRSFPVSFGFHPVRSGPGRYSIPPAGNPFERCDQSGKHFSSQTTGSLPGA